MEHKENKKVLTRQELFDLAWSMPMIDLGKKMNISDNGLRKVCRKYLIPVPKMGHWQKVRYGKTPKKPSLPNYPGTVAIAIKMMPRIKDTLEPSQVITEPVHVPEHISKFHPLIKQMRDIFSRNSKDEKGRLRSLRGDETFDVRVGPGQLSRACKIMDTIVKTLESRDVKIIIESCGEIKKATHAIIDGEEVGFSLEESLKIVKGTPPSFGLPVRELVPAGKLNLCINEYLGGCQTKWSDGKTENLEGKLASFINGLFIGAAYIKKRRLEREEEHRRHEEEQRRLIQEQQALENESKRLKMLEQQASSWEKSRMIRRFVRVAAKKKGSFSPESEFGKWVDWANAHADKLDPLASLA